LQIKQKWQEVLNRVKNCRDQLSNLFQHAYLRWFVSAVNTNMTIIVDWDSIITLIPNFQGKCLALELQPKIETIKTNFEPCDPFLTVDT
jgi:hypothetical protein